MKTSDAARGKWRQILTHFGIDSKYLDGRHHACPCSGEGEDRFRFTDQNGSGAYFCACSKGDKGGFGLLECLTQKPFKELAAEVDGLLGNSHQLQPARPTQAQNIMAIAKPSSRSAYLESRGLEVPPGLLWATSVEYFDDGKPIGKFAAMVGPVVRKGEFQTVHVTYLDRGRKANVPNPKKILPGGAIVGAGIELYPAAEEMGVAEGIETAIAAKMHFNCPTHAALNAAMLAKWDPPSVAKTVHIFADNDENYAGHAAAWQLANRLKLQGIEAMVHFPPQVGDWNDHLLRIRKEAA